MPVDQPKNTDVGEFTHHKNQDVNMTTNLDLHTLVPKKTKQNKYIFIFAKLHRIMTHIMHNTNTMANDIKHKRRNNIPH